MPLFSNTAQQVPQAVLAEDAPLEILGQLAPFVGHVVAEPLAADVVIRQLRGDLARFQGSVVERFHVFDAFDDVHWDSSWFMYSVGDGVLDIPSADRRQFGTMRRNLPIEVKFHRRVVEDADPYDGTSHVYANQPTDSRWAG